MVSIQRNGNTATVTITLNAKDILETQTTRAARVSQILNLATEEINQSQAANKFTDAQLEARAEAERARLLALRTKRPTGNL